MAGDKKAVVESLTNPEITNKWPRHQKGRATTMENNMRGMRAPYRPSWIDKKTGEKREAPIWWIVYSVKGKVHRESSHSTKEADAWKLLKKRHGEIALNK